MKGITASVRRNRRGTEFEAGPDPGDHSLEAQMEARLVGQPEAVGTIAPFVEMYRAGLSPEGRPAGVFLLLGPTGTGKTRTVEALAASIHGSEKSLIRIDCGEFQMEHEVAKLIGAPPGYLGHRETQPLLTQQKLNSVTSDESSLAIVLFDEIEKAAPSMYRLLLGVLDKGTLRLGDNSCVNFERTLIFLTSNLGAKGMAQALRPDFGFARGLEPPEDSGSRLESIALNAIRRKFSPEFLNRIDASITYRPLDRPSLERILELLLEETQDLVDRRLGPRTFHLHVPPRSRKLLLDRGTSREFGARELKRVLHRSLVQPVASLVASGRVPPGAVLTLQPKDEGFEVLVNQARAA